MYDPLDASHISLTQVPPPPCECVELQPTSALFDSNTDVQQFTPSLTVDLSTYDWVYTTDCTDIVIDANRSRDRRSSNYC